MPLQEHITRLEAAHGAPDQLALITTRILLEGKVPGLYRALCAVCVPHWFDERILTGLLGPMSAPEVREIYTDLLGFSMVQKHDGGAAHVVHDLFRSALRADLEREEPDTFIRLSARAAELFDSQELRIRIERVYHLVTARPREAWHLVRELAIEVYNTPDESQLMTKVLSEFAELEAIGDRRKACADLLTAMNGAYYHQPKERRSHALKALEGFERHDDAVWETAYSHLILGDIEMEDGHYDQAEKRYLTGHRLLKDLPSPPNSPIYLGDLVSSYDRLATLHALQPGKTDLELAIGYLREAKLERRRLFALTDARTLHDHHVPVRRLGDLLLERGRQEDIALAEHELDEDLKSAQHLAQRHPDSDQALRDVAIAQDRFGDFLSKRDQPGDPEQAMAHFQRSLNIRRGSVATGRHPFQAERDLTLSLDRIGDLYAHGRVRAPGSTPEQEAEQAFMNASEHYTESLALRRSLLSQYPGSKRTRRDVFVVLNKLCALHCSTKRPQRQEDVQVAIQHIEEALQIGYELQRECPLSPIAQRDVAIAFTHFGDVLTKRKLRNDDERALELYKASLDIRKTLARRYPRSAQSQRDLILILDRCYKAYQRLGKKRKVRLSMEECLRLLDRMHTENMYMGPELQHIRDALRHNLP